jgi:hypothetical protein
VAVLTVATVEMEVVLVVMIAEEETVEVIQEAAQEDAQATPTEAYVVRENRKNNVFLKIYIKRHLKRCLFVFNSH